MANNGSITESGGNLALAGNNTQIRSINGFTLADVIR
jgi:hypothetical protein